jgi:hypothetical protein
MSCDANTLYIDVRSFNSFNGSSYPPPQDQDGNLNGNFDTFNLGQSSMVGGDTIVLYRALYKWKLFTPIFGQYFANMPGNIRLLSVTMAFRNEPY